jgi:hypothetical protein
VKRRQLRFSAKLTGLQPLLERLLLRLILARPAWQAPAGRSGRRPTLYSPACSMPAPKLPHLRLIGKHGAGLLFGKTLLTGGLVKADALRGGLQKQIVSSASATDMAALNASPPGRADLG